MKVKISKCCINIICFISFSLSGQSLLPGQSDFKWGDNFVNYKQVPDSLKEEDAVILKEQLDLSDDYIKRRVSIKIQNADGIKAFQKIQLPENFDLTNFPNFSKQGHFKDRKVPPIYKYEAYYFSARIIKPNKRIINLQPEPKWIKLALGDSPSKYLTDYITEFQIESIEIGDILEYEYKANIDWKELQNVVYPNSVYPKMDYNLKIVTLFTSLFSNIKLVYNYKVPEANTKYSKEYKSGQNINTQTYHFDFLSGIRYPEKAVVGINLPNISMNHGVYFELTTGAGNFKTKSVFDKYLWRLNIDTMPRAKTFDKEHSTLSKFISKFPTNKDDTSGNIFLSQVIDTLDAIGISLRGLPMGENSKQKVLTDEELFKKQILKYVSYATVLKETKRFFFNCVLIDRRYSVINPDYRNHSEMERSLIVVPEINSLKYYMLRNKYMTYLPDELPFYFEGTKCVLIPCYDCANNSKHAQLLFETTPKSSFSENLRTETGAFKVIMDSLKIQALIKENLCGQFSTILRHYYNGEYIDSTISEHYFKKCSDKPNSKNFKLKQTSMQKVFPFKCSYSCTGEIVIGKKNEVDLKDWFSFSLIKEQLVKLPNHDFFMDFPYTDTYNYLFEFDKPVEIINMESFTKKLSNVYFEINSGIVKQSENKYLITVFVKIKQIFIPKSEASKIVEFISILKEINDYKLNFKS